jgi:hypothetical protein
MANEMNLWKRLKGETPKFFKRVFALSVSLSAGAGALLIAPTLITGFVLPAGIVTLCQWIIAGGMAAAAVSKTTVTTPPPPQPPYSAPKDSTV